jgi:hypothetical protein
MKIESNYLIKILKEKQCKEVEQFYKKNKKMKVLEELNNLITICSFDVDSEPFSFVQTNIYKIHKWTQRLNFDYYIREEVVNKADEKIIEETIIKRYKNECDLVHSESSRLKKLIQNNPDDIHLEKVFFIKLINRNYSQYHEIRVLAWNIKDLRHI